MRTRPLIPALVLVAAAGTVARSEQSAKFLAERNRLHLESLSAQKARGIDLNAAAKQFPASAVQPVQVPKVLPGGSLAVSLAGKITPGVTVLSDRDGAVISGATTTAASYAARLTIGAGEGPGFVKLWAISPVSFEAAIVPVAFIDTVYRFDLKAANGVTVKVLPTEKTFSIPDNKNATLNYQAEFYKPGEAKPFETRVGAMRYGAGEEPRSRLDIALWEATPDPEKEMGELSQKLADPKLTDAQRETIGEQLAKAQQRMMDNLMKTMTADPAAVQKKTDDFGCRLVQVYPAADGTAKATVLCGKNFSGGALQTTATIAMVR